VLRALAKKQRKVSGLRRMPARTKDRQLAVRRVAVGDRRAEGAFVGSYRLQRTAECHRRGTLDVDILLDIQTTSARRRIEMEINSATTHLARIRYRTWAKKKRALRLRLSGTILNPAPDETLELVSRPSRQLRRYASAAERDRYGDMPFRVISCRIR
jgi:hypothetical protein